MTSLPKLAILTFVCLAIAGAGTSVLIALQDRAEKQPARNVSRPPPRVRTPEELEALRIERTTFAREELPENPVISTNIVRVGGPVHGFTGQLLHEAFLMVCREDFHLPTRDDYLREAASPENSLQIHPVMSFLNEQKAAENPRYTISLAKEFGKRRQIQLREGKLDGDLKIDVAYREQQGLVAEDFIRMMEQIGFHKADIRPADRDVKDLLLITPPLDVVQLLVNLRRLHQALLSDPRSPAITASLCDHYSVLGSLSEIHWGHEHRTFKSRALVYSSRGLSFHPEEERLLWSSALAFGLSGLEYQAKPILEKVQAKYGMTNAPEWGPSLIAFVSWDEPELKKLADDNRPMAKYFRMRATEMCGTGSQFISAVTDVLKDHPECYRGSVVLAHTGPLGLRRAIERAQLEQFIDSLPRTILKIDSLPQSVIDAANAVLAEESLENKYAPTAALVKELKNVAETSDRAEPSLAVFATVIENLHMNFAIQVLNTLKFQLATDATDAIPPFEQLLGHHSAKKLLQAYNSDTQVAMAAVTAATTPVMHLGPNQYTWSMTRRLTSADSPYSYRLSLATSGDVETVTPELLTLINGVRGEERQNPLLKRLQRISPDCPHVKGYLIAMHWDDVSDKAADWVEATTNPNLVNRLAAHYLNSTLVNEEDFPLAEKYYKKSLELDPSHTAYTNLANLYRNAGQRDLYRETLGKALSLPDLGLESAEIQTQIARSYMREGRFSEARPFALAAADSYSEWGLQCAGRCLEGLGELEEAEKYYEAKARRYRSAIDWYGFCRRTGHGDLQSARELYLSNTRLDSEEKRDLDAGHAVFSYLEGNLDEAVRVFLNINRKNPGNDAPLAYLSLILLEQGKFDEAAKYWRTTESASQCSMIFDQVFTGESPKFDWSPSELEFLEYFWPAEEGPGRSQVLIGGIHYFSGQTSAAIPFLQRAESDEGSGFLDRTLAGFLLRKEGIPVTLGRKKSVDTRHPRFIESMVKFQLVRNKVDAPTRKRLIDNMVSASPHCHAARFWAAIWLLADREVAGAEKYLSEILEELPRMNQVRMVRGTVNLHLKRYDAAKDELESLLKTIPHHPVISNNLAWIYAAAPDATLRDGRRAKELVDRFIELTPRHKTNAALLTAASMAECGEFDEAIQVLETAIKENSLIIKPKRADQAPYDPTFLLERFRAKEPYHSLPENSPPAFLMLAG